MEWELVEVAVITSNTGIKEEVANKNRDIVISVEQDSPMPFDWMN